MGKTGEAKRAGIARKTISFAIAAAVLAVAVTAGLASCSKKQDERLICGVTIYEPMNYQDESGEWTGFDTEFAKMVGEKLGMEVDFQEIVWDNKYSELEAGTISCIWNAFSANTAETDGAQRTDLVDFSYSYMLNQQCVVVNASRLDEFASAASVSGKSAVAEKGSAGESAARTLIGESGSIIDAAAQVNAFTEVKSGAADCAVVDLLLAQKIAGQGDYSDLAIAEGIALPSEIYAVGFQKGNELRDKVNEAMAELNDEGKLSALAEKYNLQNTFLLDTSFTG